MENHSVVVENWLTRKTSPGTWGVVALTSFILFVLCYWGLTGFGGADEWMPASGRAVFSRHEYWRLWTALFAHADAGHLFNNAFLFIPLTYLLVGYYGWLFFPVMGLALGGLINFLVLKSLPAGVSLVGISGVVYWMGAVWLTLFILIDTRKSLRHRFGIALISSFVLFFPEAYKEEVSYVSHFLGYVFGILSGVAYYFVRRKEIQAAEVRVPIIEDEIDFMYWHPLQKEENLPNENWN